MQQRATSIIRLSKDDSHAKSISHKDEEVHSYCVDFKLEVICYDASHSSHAAAKRYRVDRNIIHQWRKK